MRDQLKIIFKRRNISDTNKNIYTVTVYTIYTIITSYFFTDYKNPIMKK